jgi:heptosyltransferase-1
VKFLIVKTSSMGDVVHALPMASDIRRLYPAAQIDWLVEPAFAVLPALHRDVSQVHRLAWRRWRRQLFKSETWRAMGELVDTLRDARYDLVIDAQGLLKSACWARSSRAPVAGYDRHSIREPLASLLYMQRHEVPYSLHAIDRCRLLAAAALKANTLQLPAPDFGLQQVQRYEHAELSAPYAVLIPNASRPEKHWPQVHWQALGQHLQSQGLNPVVLWGSPAEEAMAKRIAEGCQGWVPPFLTVQEATALLAGSRLVVGLDTGFSHVAAALGKPVVGIYCDHEPALAGITGSGPVASLGGRGQQPSFDEVRAALERVTLEAGL